MTKCLDCEKIISSYAKRCRSCANRHSALIGKTGFQKGHKVWERKHHTKESKLKMKENHNLKSNPYSGISYAICPTCNKLKENHHKMDCRECYKKRVSGESSRLWQGGKTTLAILVRTNSLYLQWRKEIMERDNFTCKECGQYGGKLVVDHIKPFAIIIEENQIDTLEKAMNCDELWNTENGQILCSECHRKTDTYGHLTTKLIKSKLMESKVGLLG